MKNVSFGRLHFGLNEWEERMKYELINQCKN
jgi:hypothetical protein